MVGHTVNSVNNPFSTFKSVYSIAVLALDELTYRHNNWVNHWRRGLSTTCGRGAHPLQFVKVQVHLWCLARLPQIRYSPYAAVDRAFKLFLPSKATPHVDPQAKGECSRSFTDVSHIGRNFNRIAEEIWFEELLNIHVLIWKEEPSMHMYIC